MSSNDFRTDLAWSESHHKDQWWEPYYRKAFPTLISVATVPGPSPAQRAGIDKFVMLKGGKRLAVDEKIRRNRPPTDFVLEFQHVPTDQGPPWDGWIEKENSHTDFIAYGFLEFRVAFFIPFPTLQTAWVRHNEQWKAKYGILKAANPRENPRYHTHFVAVPAAMLLGCILDAIRVVL